MKKTVFALLILSTLLLCSCEKVYLVPESELPQWLKTDIQEAEQSIKENPKGWPAMGAWVRTRWDEAYFYEYHNPVLSSMPRPISHSGDTLDMWVGDTSTDYNKEKCCNTYVWKGPKYIGLFD